MEYSICIRTLGTAGDKYVTLLESIKKLTMQPKEIIVVIPDGYEMPSEKLGTERVVRSDKGMLLQRIVGYEQASSEYVLLLDDDVKFEENIIEKLSEPLLEGKASITFPIYPELLPLSGIRSVIGAITLSAVPRFKNDNNFIKILPSGGYSYNNNINDKNENLYSESAPGMCLFAKTAALRNINLIDELWVEKPGYALRDDAILIYKALLEGYRTIGVANIIINHLDAGVTENNRNIKAAYANTFNHILFWKRFVKSKRIGWANNTIAILSILHWTISTVGYLSLKLIISRDAELYKAALKGIAEGFKYIFRDNVFKELCKDGENRYGKYRNSKKDS